MSQSSSPQRRRDKRYPARLPIRTRVAGRLKDLFSEDVSYRGLFLASDSPPPLRQLIRIETLLPPGATPFATHGMVVHVIAPGEGGIHGPGFGVQFYGMGDERRVWEAFVHYIQQTAAALPDRRESRPPPIARSSLATGSVRIGHGSAAQDNRRFQRFPVVLEVRPRDLEDLYRLYSRDVSAGGMFLATPREIEVGEQVRLDVRHPHSASVFHLSAIVRRRSGEPAGIGVEFVGLDDQRRREFFDFIHAPIAVHDEMDDELELIESDDRRR
ncbi:MAG TPA: PilZ domain-containing protein [Kofleriaceae bacterium]|nr:PilZ domain-containing protein [Kofleriaceae bacterium]